MFTIFHFGEFGILQQRAREPKCGVQFFLSLLRRERKKNPHSLTLFSGGMCSQSRAFKSSKSLLQKLLKQFEIDAAGMSIDDFNFLSEQTIKAQDYREIPWLASNVYKEVQNIRSSKRTKILEIQGFKIGIFSIVGKQLAGPVVRGLKIDYGLAHVRQAVQLFRSNNCHLIVGLSNMKDDEDQSLAERYEGIDIIFGNFNNQIRHKIVENTLILRSGSKFRSFSQVKVHRKSSTKKNIPSNKGIFLENSRFVFEIHVKETHHCDQQIINDNSLKKLLSSQPRELMIPFKSKTAFYVDCQISLQLKDIRAKPSLFLSFLAEIYRIQHNCDIGIFSGTNFNTQRKHYQSQWQGNSTFIPGPILYQIFNNLMRRKVQKRLVTGNTLLLLCENHLMCYPQPCKQFVHFSGLTFQYDEKRPIRCKVIKESLLINNKKMALEQQYTIAVDEHISFGSYGYEFLKECKHISTFLPKWNYQLIQDVLDSAYPQYKYSQYFQRIQINGEKSILLKLLEKETFMKPVKP